MRPRLHPPSLPGSSYSQPPQGFADIIVFRSGHSNTWCNKPNHNQTMSGPRDPPSSCESPAFACPCPAQIYNRAVGHWFCAYCSSQNYTALNLCRLCAQAGRCVDKETGDWYCGEHGHQCDVVVPRPERCGWPVRKLPCFQLARMHDFDGRNICHDHLQELITHHGTLRFRSPGLQIRVQNVFDRSAPTPLLVNGETFNLDNISTLTERECPICRGPRVRWRRLKACGHEICETCLREQMSSTLANRFLCPFGRRSLFDVASS